MFRQQLDLNLQCGWFRVGAACFLRPFARGVRSQLVVGWIGAARFLRPFARGTNQGNNR
jgi:hypothetical protein